MSDSHVYIQDKEHGWLPANVLENNKDTARVRVFGVDEKETLGERTVSLQDYPSGSLPLQNVDASGNLVQMEDMVDLPSLHEAAILYNLRARHMAQQPYTRVGELIIAVNPFQWLQDLYSVETRSQYVDKLIWNATPGPSGLAPHVYETSSLAFTGLAHGQCQSILVSGESGAGKTESVKILMSHLASVHAAPQEEMEESQHHHLVVQRVLDSHPLLEAFGNAKTVRNDNSSRFGKYIQMQFDVEDATTAQFSGRAVPHCVLAGSTSTTYLLEKSRVVGHESQERTYHVFYQLLAAPDDVKRQFWDGLVGKTNASFRYVGNTDTVRIEGKTDAERWETTLEALTVLDVTGDRLQTLMRAVCVVLQLGNIEFQENPNDTETCIISSKDELQALADLMGIPVDALEKALTFRTVVAGKESYTVPLKLAAACDGCDAFAKEIYQQVFDWLVKQINRVTCAEENYDDDADVQDYGVIGLLDIFGFESFEVNRFEQLCINYTNEKLQQKYTLDVFRSVQEEYTQEGIELGELSFDDNADVLNLIEGRVGIISVLNEECVRPNGNDTAFVSKIKTVNSEAATLVSEKLHKPKEFAIQHYAGKVTYDATNFVQKNTDMLPKDVIDCACLSTNELIKVELKAAADEKASGDKSVGKRGASKLTVTTKFKHQLSKLMHDVSKTHTRYIRCIKPNPEKQPLQMNMSSSAEQLRCAGVVAAVTVSRVGFPNRLMHETVLDRFGCLGTVEIEDDEKKEEGDVGESRYGVAASKLLEGLLKDLEVAKDDDTITKAFAVGRSRIYFRTGALEFLEAKRLEALSVFATAIARIVRGFTARSKFWKIKYAAIDSQANARRVLARKSFLRACQACLSLECWVRCVYAKRELIRLRRERASIKLQSRWRSVVAVLILAKNKSAAAAIQKIARGYIQRPKYRQALKEAEEEARVNTKLAALQKRLQEAEMRWIQADKKRIEAEKRADGVASPAPVTTNTEGSAAVVIEEEEKKSDGGASSVQQQALIDESNEMLEYFRKEVFKLKSANYLLRNDLAEAKEENKHFAEHCQSLEASHSALKQNMQKMSENNMRLAVASAAQKEAMTKLRQESKMEKIKLGSEIKKMKSEMQGKDRQHDGEVTRLKRELERMRKIIAKTPNAMKGPPPRYQRASFKNTRRDSAQPVSSSFSRTSSFADMSMMSADLDSLEEWGHDGFYSRESPAPEKRQSGDWTVVVSPKKKKESRNRKPPGRYNKSYNKGKSPKPPTTPTSSLSAAAASGRSKQGEAPTRRGPSPRGHHAPKPKGSGAKVKKSKSQSSLANALNQKTTDFTPRVTNKKNAPA